MFFMVTSFFFTTISVADKSDLHVFLEPNSDFFLHILVQTVVN